jgi:hypothetical protein
MTALSDPITLLQLANPVPPGSLREVAAEGAEDLLARLRADEVAAPTISMPHRGQIARRSLQIAVAVVIALAIASVATPLGAAIGRTFDGFSNWITGSPGTPASPQAQRAFEKANVRSWTGFPPGTKLRNLITTSAVGSTFTLYGFRSGDALCLRLVATGPAHGATESCAPLQALQSAKEPALVVASDEGFGIADVPPSKSGYRPDLASATFGIASDGVRKVILRGDDGTKQAIVASNSFLSIDAHPKLGARVRSAEAVAANGSIVALALVAAPFGDSGTAAPDHFARPTGPTQVDRQISGGTVSWLEQRQDRGQPIAPKELKRLSEGALSDVTFARAVQPDPANPARIAFLIGKPSHDPFHQFAPGEEQLCVFLVQGDGGGGGCYGPGKWFLGDPLNFGISLASGADQYAELAGMVSDDVARVRIFLTNGTIEDVPVKDNAFAVPVARPLMPARVVAYDSASRIIGIDTVGDPTVQAPPPANGADWKMTEHAVAADGTSATISTAPARGGGLCWRIRFSDGTIGGGPRCSPPYWESNSPVSVEVNETQQGGAFVFGRVSPEVASVVVHYRDGRMSTTTPRRGLVLVAAPQKVKPSTNPVGVVTALDKNGKPIGSEDFSHAPAIVLPTH